MFIDRVALTLEAGCGGRGSTRWSRRKYHPKGGPSGGNGGPGGSVYLLADDQMHSLEKWSRVNTCCAEPGCAGGSEKCTGSSGNDLVLTVPCGTVVKEAQSDAVIADLTVSGQRELICNGGRGGRGNASFATSTRRTPYLCTEGESGQLLNAVFELKLLSDVGLIGAPNSGKSALLNTLTGAKAEVGEYPFTTKGPNLGSLDGVRGAKLAIADIPGIMEGAHRNKGLGLKFLRHISRASLLAFVLDASPSGGDLLLNLQTLRRELERYDPSLASRPAIAVLSKCDLDGASIRAKRFQSHASECVMKIVQISTLNTVGFQELRRAILECVGSRHSSLQ